MIRFYMDVHIDKAITEGLRKRGVDVLTAQEDGTLRLSDPELLDRATELGRVLFTRDRGFLAEAARRQSSNQPFVGIVYASQLDVSIGQCIEDLELIAYAGKPEEFADQVRHLPLH